MSDNDDLDLPFAYHFSPGPIGRGGAALVFTTEPANETSQDRQQVDVLAVLEADNGDKFGDRASALAEFVTAALNAFVSTEKGLQHWKTLHPLMEQMRNAGRQ
jgi:hypothetical protein